MRRIGLVALCSAIGLAMAGLASWADPVAQLHPENLPGRLVPVTQDIRDFFAARGANPADLGMSKDQIPAADWMKIEQIITTPDDTTVTTDDHDVLNELVDAALVNATTTTDDPVYMDLGDQRWTYYEQTTIAPSVG